VHRAWSRLGRILATGSWLLATFFHMPNGIEKKCSGAVASEPRKSDNYFYSLYDS